MHICGFSNDRYRTVTRLLMKFAFAKTIQASTQDTSHCMQWNEIISEGSFYILNNYFQKKIVTYYDSANQY